MDRHFGNYIWTNHALERLAQRGISQGDAWAVLNRPAHSRYARTKSAWVFSRNFNGREIEVVAKKNRLGEWVVLSIWDSRITNYQPLWRVLYNIIRRLW